MPPGAHPSALVHRYPRLVLACMGLPFLGCRGDSGPPEWLGSRERGTGIPRVPRVSKWVSSRLIGVGCVNEEDFLEEEAS